MERDAIHMQALREPVPDAEHVARHPEVPGWTCRPFLLGRAVKQR